MTKYNYNTSDYYEINTKNYKAYNKSNVNKNSIDHDNYLNGSGDAGFWDVENYIG